MKRSAFAVLAAIAGYIFGAIGGYFLITVFSSNTHDRSVEAAMTAAFVCGPLGALIASVVTFGRTRA